MGWLELVVMAAPYSAVVAWIGASSWSEKDLAPKLPMVYVAPWLLKTKFSRKAGVVGGVRNVGSCIRADDEYLVVSAKRPPPLAFRDSGATGVFGVGGAAEPGPIGERFL